MLFRHTPFVIAVLLTLNVMPVRALDVELENAAATLSAATVTVRFAVPAAQPEQATDVSAAKQQAPAADKSADTITVCTGVCVAEGLIITQFVAPTDWEQSPLKVRCTLTGGEQLAATVAVIDRASSLVLLETKGGDLPRLRPAGELPRVGAWLLTAAAAGIEAPAVSIGTLAARERSLSGIDLPPVIQCDLRTTETSSGAGVINQAGELIGIIAAVEQSSAQRGGLSYAVGVRHVERLIKAHIPGKTIELKRQRPMVGVTFGPGAGEGVVRVERVVPDGPAAKVGLQVGDVLLEADEVKVRSAYQAVDQVLRKQPGDQLRLLVERNGVSREFRIELAGATATPVTGPRPPETAAVQVGPHVKAVLRDGRVIVQGSDAGQVAVDPANPSRRSPGDEAEMLRMQLRGYERVIQGMQQEIEVLRGETARLKQELKSSAAKTAK